MKIKIFLLKEIKNKKLNSNLLNLQTVLKKVILQIGHMLKKKKLLKWHNRCKNKETNKLVSRFNTIKM